MLPSGSLYFMFSRKAVFEVVKPSGDIEELELELIDAGLTDIEEDGETITIYGDYTSFGTLSEGIDKMGLEVKKGSLQFIPNSTVNLDESALGELERLLDKLEDDDDVQAVYTNIE